MVTVKVMLDSNTLRGDDIEEADWNMVGGQVWRAYRDLCGSEKLLPAGPIEEYVRFVLRNGSALAVLNIMQGMEKARSEGLEAYTRVLLNWYVNGRQWIHISDESTAPIEPMLLHALKDVNNPQLRQRLRKRS